MIDWLTPARMASFDCVRPSSLLLLGISPSEGSMTLETSLDQSYSRWNINFPILNGIAVRQNLYAWNIQNRIHMCPNAQLSGLHSRSEELIEVTMAYDRGQTDSSKTSNLLDRETLQIIDLQKRLGFEYLSDGALCWQDPLRPLTGVL